MHQKKQCNEVYRNNRFYPFTEIDHDSCTHYRHHDTDDIPAIFPVDFPHLITNSDLSFLNSIIILLKVLFKYFQTNKKHFFTKFLLNRKTPETLRFRGILRLDTTLFYDNKSIFRLYYSMIVATRPDPTVRSPSRL